MLRVVVLFAGLLAGAVALHAQTPAKTPPAEKKSVPAPVENKPVMALTPPAQPRGVYATIDLVPMREVIRRLETTGQRSAAAREVLKNPSAVTPQVLYALANVLSGDRPEDAIFWYHVGRVRAVYDAFRCKDDTARNVIPEMGRKLSAELVRSQYFQRDHLEGIAKKAIAWDAQNPRSYDQRWVCLYGRVARTSPGTDAAEVQKPESEWPEILRHIHAAHLKSVREFAAQPAPTR